MEKLLKIGLILVFLCLFPSCVINEFGSYSGFSPQSWVGGTDKCSFSLDKFTGSRVKWKQSKFPIVFYVHESVPSEAQDNFIASIDEWNMVWAEYLEKEEGEQAFSLFEVKNPGVKYKGTPGNDGYNMLFFKNDFEGYGGNGKIQAVTALITSRGQIQDSDIIVNDETFKYFFDEEYNQDIVLSKSKFQTQRSIASSKSIGFLFQFKNQMLNFFQFFLKVFQKKKDDRHPDSQSRRNLVPRRSVDFVSLMIHELGHVPGLAHFDKDSTSLDANLKASKSSSSKNRRAISVMEPKLANGRSRRNIGDYDLKNLFCGYFQ